MKGFALGIERGGSKGLSAVPQDVRRAHQGAVFIPEWGRPAEPGARAARLSNVLELCPLKVSCWLNERPTTVYGKVLWPEQAMREMVAGL